MELELELLELWDDNYDEHNQDPYGPGSDAGNAEASADGGGGGGGGRESEVVRAERKAWRARLKQILADRRNYGAAGEKVGAADGDALVLSPYGGGAREQVEVGEQE